jgi:peptidoglycan hydrolase-like protein with peptidoglycan-binding domain
MKSPAMKRTIAHLLVALVLAGFVRADQTIQSVQQTLRDQGFYYGNVSGDKSAETTAAIRRYQIRNGLQVTGEINPETLSSLNGNSKFASAAQPSSKPTVTQSTSVRRDESSPIGQNSPSRSPTEADRQPEANPAFAGAPVQSVPPRISARAAVAEVQRQLMSRGYYQGRIDGRPGRRTAFALRAFQFQSGLPPTGRLDTSTLDALGLSTENLASMAPASRAYQTWVPVTKFKHGKWKVKWKKVHRDNPDEYGLEDRAGDRDDWSYGEGRDD